MASSPSDVSSRLDRSQEQEVETNEHDEVDKDSVLGIQLKNIRGILVCGSVCKT